MCVCVCVCVCVCFQYEAKKCAFKFCEKLCWNFYGGCVVSAGLAILLQLTVFSMDYSRTEYVQFEDDEYYYYVKAVPKLTIAVPEKRVKKISSQRKQSTAKKRTPSTRRPVDHARGTAHNHVEHREHAHR